MPGTRVAHGRGPRRGTSMILADTNVVSEFMRPVMDPGVMAWASSLAPSEVCVSAVTVQEVEFGIQRLAGGQRKDRLRLAWDGLLEQFEDLVVAYDRDAALATAAVMATAAGRGRTMSLADAQIAGTCLAHNLVLATRNTGDFDHEARLVLVNPFT